MKVGIRKNIVSEILDQRAEQTVRYALAQIRESSVAPYVERVILYGSCARREHSYDSDVDLLLQLRADIDREQYHSDLLSLRGHVSPLCENLQKVDLRVVIGDQWEQDPSLFYENIKKEGIELWQKM